MLRIRLIAFAVLLTTPLAPIRGEDATSLPTFQWNDYVVAPLRVHLLRPADDANVRTTLTAEDIERIVTKVNRVWSQAGIAFYVESIVEETSPPVEAMKAAISRSRGGLLKLITPEHYGAEVFNVYYLKQFDVNGIYFPKAIFVKDSASLREVAGGIDEPIPRVTSHELGHALGLQHRQDTFNLMASGTTGTTLNPEEIATARKQALELNRFQPAKDIRAKAEAMLAEGKPEESARLMLQLRGIPGIETPTTATAPEVLQKAAR